MNEPKDFVKCSYGWDALELIFMLQSHSYDFGGNMSNNEVDRKVKDDRIQYCFAICNKLVYNEQLQKEDGKVIRYPTSRFYCIPSLKDLPEGCLYSKQLPDFNFKNHHHFCCGSKKNQVINSFLNPTRLYRIFLKPGAKVLFLQKAIDTIIRKSYMHRLFRAGKIQEPYEIIILGKDVEKIERVKES